MAHNLPSSPQGSHFPKEQESFETARSAKGVKGRPSFEPLDEISPLLSPEGDDFRNGDASPIPRTPSGMLDWGDEDEEESKSVWYLFLLTLSIGG